MIEKKSEFRMLDLVIAVLIVILAAGQIMDLWQTVKMKEKIELILKLGCYEHLSTTHD